MNPRSGAATMALAVELPLPETVVSARNQSALASLIERAVAGDAAAFEQIMIHSQQRVMALSWRMLGNEADARDASQEVFLRVYKYLRRYDPKQDFFAWLYRITANVCRDTIKKRRHQENFTSLSTDADTQVLEIPAAHDNAEQLLLTAQRRELLAQAIATLPYKERASIVLRDMEEFTTEEVAQILQSSATTVRSQISSARKKIKDYCRRALNSKGGPDEL